jgi:hypothetical protein
MVHGFHEMHAKWLTTCFSQVAHGKTSMLVLKCRNPVDIPTALRALKLVGLGYLQGNLTSLFQETSCFSTLQERGELGNFGTLPLFVNPIF